MKICIVTSSVRKGDGQARVNYEIVKEAIQRGHQVTLVVRKAVDEISQHKLVNCVYFPVDKVPTELMRGFVFAQKSDRWLKKHRHEFDIVVSCGAVTTGESDVNVVHFVHSAWLDSPFHTSRVNKNLYGLYQWLYTSLNAYWERVALKKAKILVAVSGTIKKEIIGVGIPADRIKVILNGVDVDEFIPIQTPDRSQFGLPEKADLALFVGDKTNRKNLDSVLKALVNVPDLHLAVVGNLEKSTYPQMVKSLKLEERVHFLGYRSDIAKIMQVVDFFVFPSRYEPFGMVVTEAMASGLPVIITKASGVADIVTPDCGVTLTDSEDILALTSALKKLSSEKSLRREMGQSARAIAEQHPWNTKSCEYVDLFESVIGQ
ncbi:MAG: glycosyl transferase [Pseudanabaena sp.]|nr:MAG: glycosyl transferase [Pseudanabaena sp.]